MRFRAPLAAFIVGRRRIADALEVDELDRVAVGVVEIGVTAGEAAVALVLVQQHLDAAGFDMRERGIEILDVEHEGVMDQRIAAPVLRRMIAGARQHEILLAAAHEHRGVVLAPEGGADDLLVEPPGLVEIGHAEGEMQDAGRL